MSRIDEKDMPKERKKSLGTKRKAITYDMPRPATQKDEVTGLAIIKAMEWYLPLSARAAVVTYESESNKPVAAIMRNELANMTLVRKAVLLTDLLTLQKSIEIVTGVLTEECLKDSAFLTLSKDDFETELVRQFESEHGERSP